MKVGNTPLLKVDEIFTKLECINPTGSVKDRIAKYIIDESEKKGLLKPGMKIVEATSGNTGISMSYYAAEKGYEITMVMPSDLTEERKSIIKNLGAELIFCSEGNFAEAAAIRNEMALDSNYFNPDQFSNPLNVECHYKTTGPEIIEQMKHHEPQINAFVAGVGTGGTLIGVGKALKERFPDVRIVAVEPSESAVMSGGKPGMHGIQGIGDGFVPAIAQGEDGGLHPLIDEVIRVSTEEAQICARYLQVTKGFCVGMSSGANFHAAKLLNEKYKTVVTMFADGYSKYVALGLQKSRRDIYQHQLSCFCPGKEVQHQRKMELQNAEQ